MLIIYMIKNKINGKIYIGQTKRSLDQRITGHINSKNNSYIGNALRKYGLENFDISIVDQAENNEVLNDKEMEYIKFYDCMIPKGYNLTSGGEGIKDYIFSEESKDKMSNSHKGKPGYWEGKELPEYVKEKIRQTHKGVPSPLKGKTGRKQTAETKEKIAAAGIGRIVTEETREKISRANLGKVMSEETKTKLSIINKGKPNLKNKGRKRSEEEKEKIRKSKKGVPWTQTRRDAQNKRRSQN